jgi:hypothetical protein
MRDERFARGVPPATSPDHSIGRWRKDRPPAAIASDARRGRRRDRRRWRQASFRGATPEEVVQSFPSLDLAVVYAILAWVVSRRAEVDAYLERRVSDEAAARTDSEARAPAADLRARLLAY